MNSLQLSDFGSTMVELYSKLRTIRQSVYEEEVKHQVCPEAPDEDEYKAELHVKVWQAFSPVMDYMTERILYDAKDLLCYPEEE